MVGTASPPPRVISSNSKFPTNGASTKSGSSPLHPSVLWSETKDFVFITVEVYDVKEMNVDLQEKSLSFEATAADGEYAFSLEFPHEINKQESKYNKERNVQIKLVKAEPQRWKKLSVGGKLHWLKCDWGKWLDTDDEDEGKNMNTGDFDMGSMDFGGMGGGGDMEDDSDDEAELPDLDAGVDLDDEEKANDDDGKRSDDDVVLTNNAEEEEKTEE